MSESLPHDSRYSSRHEHDVDWRSRAEAAERTVEVLKAKVKGFYAASAETLVHRQLVRQRQRRERVELRAIALERYNNELEVEVVRRTAAMQMILDNVTFGFVVIDRELRLQPGVTKSCDDLFGRAVVAGESLVDILNLSERKANELLLGVDQVFEDIMPEEVTTAQIPSRYETFGKAIHIDARVVRTSTNEIRGLLLTVSDTTALENAQRQNHHHEVLVGILRQRGSFKDFADDSLSAIETAKVDPSNQIFARRAVHTVKGNAASYGLDAVVEIAHRIESGETVDSAGLDELADGFTDFLFENEEVLGIRLGQTEATFTVGEARLNELETMMCADAVDATAVRRWVSNIVMRPVVELLGPIAPFVSTLAERLEKEVQFEIYGANLPVDVQVMRPILANVSHLLRNTVDHGIEYCVERGEKNLCGTIELRIHESKTDYVVTLSDDGRGIDFESLKNRAVLMGRVTAEAAAALTREGELDLLFSDGLSSVDSATNTSGRGIGMSAVKAAVDAAHGSIQIETEVGVGTTTTIRVPKKRI